MMDSDVEHPVFVSAGLLGSLLAQIRAENLNVEELFQSVGLPLPDKNDSALAPISLGDFYRLRNRMSVLLGDETLHMSSRQLLQGSTDFVLQHAADCRSLYEVMRVIARSYNLLHGGQFNSVVKRRGSIDYIIDDRAFPYTPGQPAEFIHFSIECVLIFLHCMLMVVSPTAKDAVRALQIRRPSPGGDCGHLAYWRAPISFGADAYRISFDRKISLDPIDPPAIESLTTNSVYQKIVDEVAGVHAHFEQRHSAAQRVKDALMAGTIEQADVAAQMGVSVATLRRRLTEEGVSFRDLKQACLNETAQRLLREGASVAGVAEALGFSEFRSFNRAFKAWNGQTPRAFQISANR